MLVILFLVMQLMLMLVMLKQMILMIVTLMLEKEMIHLQVLDSPSYPPCFSRLAEKCKFSQLFLLRILNNNKIGCQGTLLTLSNFRFFFHTMRSLSFTITCCHRAVKRSSFQNSFTFHNIFTHNVQLAFRKFWGPILCDPE